MRNPENKVAPSLQYEYHTDKEHLFLFLLLICKIIENCACISDYLSITFCKRCKMLQKLSFPFDGQQIVQNLTDHTKIPKL